jgi:endonuclease IV
MKIGPHVNGSGGLYNNIVKAIDKAKKCCNFDITAAAIFVAGPRTYKINITKHDIDKIPTLNLDIFVHNTYVSVPWKGDYKAIHSIREQLRICESINAKGFIIHLPKELSIDMIINVFPKLIIPDMKTKIYLEIPSLKPSNSVFHLSSNLNILFDNIKKYLDDNMKYFGLCIDTAHLWSSGLDISDYDSVVTWLNELTIDYDNIMIHCNDNDKLLGECPDIHNTLFKGNIWKGHVDNITGSGLYAFIEYSKRYNIPIILERHMDNLLINDYIILQNMI